jgi:hypothetical protein
MKSLRHILVFAQIAAATLLIGVVGAHAAVTNSPAGAAKTKSAAVTNAAPEELPIPISVFNLAGKPTKDPFFPLSLRQPITQSTNASPVFSAAMFTLKGLSGSAHSRLALINNRTVAAGENAEITTPSGRIKIHCLEVKEGSAIIRAETQSDPVEIFLRKSAQ